MLRHSVKKWSNADCCNRQRVIETFTLGRADLSDRPLLKESSCFYSCKADFCNRHPSEIKLADACHRPLYYFESHTICTTELAEEGKLGCGFTPVDDLEEIDIGPGDRPRPTYVSKKLELEAKAQLTSLLKEFVDCFAWEYHEMPGLDQSIVEHRLPIKLVFALSLKLPGNSILTF